MSTKRPGRAVQVRRNLADSTDPYQPRFDPGEVAACTGCHALYQRRHWFFDADAYFRETMQPTTRLVLCPACQKIRDRYGRVVVTASKQSATATMRAGREGWDRREIAG